MNSALFQTVFLGIFAIGIALELSLLWLNRREVKRHPSLPAQFSEPEFARHFDSDSFAKSRAYNLERLSFESLSLLFSSAITLTLLFSGFLPVLDQQLQGLFNEGLHRGVLFLATIILIQTLLKLPLTLYSTFRIEGKFGFNTMTFGLFCRDFIKGSLLSMALGLPLLYALLALMQFFGIHWWQWAFGLMLGFQLIMLVLYPIFIAPLFNRFKPLPEGQLRTALLELSERLHFPTGGIYVMDGSRRSLHSNAYFTGFGRLRRIVLFDTLLRQMDQDELLSVLAHEIGHYKRNHIYKMLAVQVVMLGALLFLASIALRWPPLYAAFGFNPTATPTSLVSTPFAGNAAAGLFLFLTVFNTSFIFLSPLQNFFSRRHEYEADAYAINAVQDSEAMQTALIKLSHKNLTNLTPHPWYSTFHYSHPTLLQRIQAIKSAFLPSTAILRSPRTYLNPFKSVP